jgi:hypothetical protein
VVSPVFLRSTVLTTLWIVLLALVAAGPALFLDRSLGPESMIDSDPLFALGKGPPRAIISDGTRTVYDLPHDFAAADGFRAGRFDLWNPRVGLGVPLWAEGGAPLFPLKLPFYLAPSRRTYDLATALRLVVAGLGAYLLARRRGLAAVPALAAGSLFELSGAMVVTLPFGFAAPLCLLPWVLLGAEAIARERTPAAAAGSGIALGVAADAGHPMLAIVVFAGFGAAIAGHALTAWRRPRTVLAIGALACLAVALGLAVGAPALLPGVEAWSAGRLYKSTPDFALKAPLALGFSRHAAGIGLFFPGLMVPLQAELPTAFPLALNSTVGVLGLFLGLVGVLRGGLDVPLAAVALLGISMTLAPPGLGWLRRVPPLHFVYATYCWVLVAVVLTQAAGRGVAVLAAAGARRVVAVALGLLVLGVLCFLLVNAFIPEAGFLDPSIRRAFMAALGRPGGWLRLALPLAVAAVVAWTVAASRAGLARRGAFVVVALASAELVASVAPTVWWRDSNVLTSPPSRAVRFLREHLDGRYRMVGVPWYVGYPSTPSLFGLPDIRAISAIPVERYLQYLQVIAPSTPWFFMQHTGDVVRHPLLDLAAVRFVVRPTTPEPSLRLEDDPAMPLVYRDERVAIYENEAALPRARIVHASVPVRDSGEAVTRLSEAAAAGAHASAVGLADRVIVEPSADGHPPPETHAAAEPASEEVQIIDSGDPDRVELLASLASPGWVVLADTFYPGWSATIDGVATPIHPTDLLFRAVFVSAGTHRVAFVYGHPPFAWVWRLPSSAPRSTPSCSLAGESAGLPVRLEAAGGRG